LTAADVACIFNDDSTEFVGDPFSNFFELSRERIVSWFFNNEDVGEV